MTQNITPEAARAAFNAASMAINYGDTFTTEWQETATAWILCMVASGQTLEAAASEAAGFYEWVFYGATV
jgi:hypothetical protein